MSEQMGAALKRALLGAILTLALTFLGTLQVTDFDNPNRVEIASVAAGVAFCTYMLSRGLGEGGYDTNRQVNGNVKASDVGALPPPQTEV